MRSWYSPASITWLGGHLFLVLIGLLFVTSEGQRYIGSIAGVSVGTSLIATGIAGLVLFLYVKSTLILEDRLRILSDAGVVNIFQHRSIRIKEHYDNRLRNARYIDLIGYGLKAFREDYGSEFADWSHRAVVRILVTDPDYPSSDLSFANIRDSEEGRQIGEIAESVLLFQRDVDGRAGLNRDKFQVRRMRAIPAINLLRIDDEIFWGPYLMGEQSRNTPTILVKRSGFMFSVLCKHFEATWCASE